MTSLVQFEPLVDSTTEALIHQLNERYAGKQRSKGIADPGLWLQYYAFDVIGELTFSKRLGFVEKGEDVEGIIGNLERFLDYAAPV